MICSWFSFPTRLPKYIKIAHKSMPRYIPSWIPFFDRFLVDFGSQHGPPIYETSSPRCSQSKILEQSFFKLTSMFERMCVPTSLHFRIKNPPKSVQKSILRGIIHTLTAHLIFVSMFWRSWLRFGNQNWSHVDIIFGWHGVTPWSSALFFVALATFYDFFAVWIPSWRHFT